MFNCQQLFDYPEQLDGWVYSKMNDRWRDHKYNIKKYAYGKWKTVEERLANPPKKNVVESQWRILVEVWDTDVKKQVSGSTLVFCAKSNN